MSQRLRAWGPALLWMAFIFVFSSRPTLPVPLGAGSDKVAHFAAYALLGALLARAYRGLDAFPRSAVLLGLAYGASDELHQHFVPGRSTELADWVADALGVVAGVYVYQAWRRSRSRGDASLSESVQS